MTPLPVLAATPFFVRLCSKIYYSHLHLLFSTITLLPCSNAHQPGSHSAIAALVRVPQDHHSAKPNGQFSPLTLLDFSMASDPAVSFLLLNSLSSRGFPYTVLLGFPPTSPAAACQPVLLVLPLLPQSLTVGRRQGSVLDLILLPLSPHPLGEPIQSRGCHYHLCAGNSQMSLQLRLFQLTSDAAVQLPLQHVHLDT